MLTLKCELLKDTSSCMLVVKVEVLGTIESVYLLSSDIKRLLSVWDLVMSYTSLIHTH